MKKSAERTSDTELESIGESDDMRLAPWSLRAGHVAARPFDAIEGAAMLVRLWGNDRFASTLAPQELERMGRFLHFVRVPADKEIISQNELGDFMVVVLEGTLLVDRVQPMGGRVRLAEVGAGEMLGEMSLLDAGMRSSTCTTLTPCTLAVVDKERLGAMAQTDPRLALALMASVSRRLSLRLRQVSSRLSALLAGR